MSFQFICSCPSENDLSRSMILRYLRAISIASSCGNMETSLKVFKESIFACMAKTTYFVTESLTSQPKEFPVFLRANWINIVQHTKNFPPVQMLQLYKIS
jgi:hypothetical protein